MKANISAITNLDYVDLASTRIGREIVFEDGSKLFILAKVINPPADELTPDEDAITFDPKTMEEIPVKDQGEFEAVSLAVESAASQFLFQFLAMIREETGAELC